MWVFLGSECLLFGGLISTYLLLRHRSVSGPQPAGRLRHPVHVGELVRAADELAHHGARRRGDHPGRLDRNRVWLATTALLGAIFISGQVYEFTTFYREGLGYTTNIFGSAFYTLTGFHGVHVSVGIIMLLSLLVLSLRGNLGARAGRDRRDRRPVLALRRHRVDRDLHRRLPDPVGATMPMTTTPPKRTTSTTSTTPTTHEHPSDLHYVKIALILAVLTALEVAHLLHRGGRAPQLLVIVLFPLMIIKFGTVIMYFMHLKFDNHAVPAAVPLRADPRRRRLHDHAHDAASSGTATTSSSCTRS